MAHLPAWHILDNVFAEQNDGLTPPERRTTDSDQDAFDVCRTDWQTSNWNTCSVAAFRLQISNLDHADPPGYVPAAVARGNTFNTNSGQAFLLSAEPRMPVITVSCAVDGFDPGVSPIYWRLQFRHVLCRHKNTGHYRYRGACEVFDVEWHGKSRAETFQLFEQTSNTTVDYDYNTNDFDTAVMGGNAILSVAALPPGCSVILKDYVHMRIGGVNPTQADVEAHVSRMLGARNANLPHMVNAIFTHENRFKQFEYGVQTATRMTFRQKHHGNDPTQPDCAVRFDWPDDPEHFPSVTFDWGVGISQYTKVGNRIIGSGVAWDWRENIRAGINEFLGNLAHQYHHHLTWRQWAHRAWRAYNGSGPQAEAYANTLEALPEGQLVSAALMPAHVDVNALTAALRGPAALGPPPSWPPFLPPGDYPAPVESAATG